MRCRGTDLKLADKNCSVWCCGAIDLKLDDGSGPTDPKLVVVQCDATDLPHCPHSGRGATDLILYIL